jgi:hypothetical protein
MTIPGPVSVEEYERTHYTPDTDDVVLYATRADTLALAKALLSPPGPTPWLLNAMRKPCC